MGCCMLFTLLLSIAPAACAIAYAVYGITTTGGCGAPLTLPVWLFVWGGLQLILFCGTLRIFMVFDAPYNPADPKNKDYLSRMNTYLCYSPFFAFFLVLIAFAVAWQVVGHVMYGSASETDCSPNTIFMTRAALAICWIYLSFCVITVGFSYISEMIEKQCLPCCFRVYFVCCMMCCCPGLANSIERWYEGTTASRRAAAQPTPLPVTSTGGAPQTAVAVGANGVPVAYVGGGAQVPMVPVIPGTAAIVPPGAPKVGMAPAVYTLASTTTGAHTIMPRAGASTAASAYATGSTLPPHQRGQLMMATGVHPGAAMPVVAAVGPPGGAHIPYARVVATAPGAAVVGMPKSAV